jgi:hypothetical protein
MAYSATADPTIMNGASPSTQMRVPSIIRLFSLASVPPIQCESGVIVTGRIPSVMMPLF